MKKLTLHEQGSGAVRVILGLAVLLLIGGAGWYAYAAHHQATTSAHSASCTTLSAGSGSSPSAFISAYKDGSTASLKVIVECGTPSKGGYSTAYSLTTNSKSITDSQYSYGSASPAGPTTVNTCKLSNVTTSTATAQCGGSTFSLAAS
jgi:hypothetical protein